MNIKDTLTAIVQHYNASRGRGHTRTMLEGVNHAPGPCIVIAANHHDKIWLEDQTPPSCVVKNLCNPMDLIAMQQYPLVIDNHAMMELCGAALREIRRMEVENETLGKLNREALREIDRHEAAIEAVAKLTTP